MKMKKSICLHEKTTDEWTTFKNGTKHIRIICQDCQKFLNFRKHEESILTGFKRSDVIYDDQREVEMLPEDEG